MDAIKYLVNYRTEHEVYIPSLKIAFHIEGAKLAVYYVSPLSMPKKYENIEVDDEFAKELQNHLIKGMKLMGIASMEYLSSSIIRKD